MTMKHKVLFLKKKQRSWFWFSLFCGLVAVVSIGLVFWQFAGFLNVHQVAEYWTRRASDRSIINHNAFLVNLVSLFKNIISNAGISLIFLGVIFFYRKKDDFPFLPLLLWVGTCILYNGLLFEWSFNHDFSIVPLGVGISMAAAYYILQIKSTRLASLSLALLCTFNMVQYYFINPPGKTARTGVPYNLQQLTGIEISKRVPTDARIFSNFLNEPMPEYYAHRSFAINKATTAAIAKHICDSLNVPKAVWIHTDTLQRILEIQTIR